MFTTAALLAMGASAPRQQREPDPQPAIPAVLAAFDTFPIVAIGDMHRTKDITDFVLALVRHPSFADKVNVIVTETANSFHQPTLDRYVRGDDVSYEDARNIWRDQASPFGSSDFMGQLAQIVREINKRRPAPARIRIVASDLGVDWNTIQTLPPADMDVRERHIAATVEADVFARGLKALMFYGGGHLRRDRPYSSSVELIEHVHPKSVFVAEAYVGITARDDCASDPAVDDRMRAWPVPAIVRVKDTWLATLANADRARSVPVPPGMFGPPKPPGDPTRGPIDAYLYLGPPRLLLREMPSVLTFADSAYLALLHERQRRLGITPVDARTNPLLVAQQDRNLLRCTPAQ